MEFSVQQLIKDEYLSLELTKGLVFMCVFIVTLFDFVAMTNDDQ